MSDDARPETRCPVPHGDRAVTGGRKLRLTLHAPEEDVPAVLEAMGDVLAGFIAGLLALAPGSVCHGQVDPPPGVPNAPTATINALDLAASTVFDDPSYRAVHDAVLPLAYVAGHTERIADRSRQVSTDKQPVPLGHVAERVAQLVDQRHVLDGGPAAP